MKTGLFAKFRFLNLLSGNCQGIYAKLRTMRACNFTLRQQIAEKGLSPPRIILLLTTLFNSASDPTEAHLQVYGTSTTLAG